MKNRYPGAQPFSTDQQPIFFGREQELKALRRFINAEQLVVLYAKSGLGKSSLLNAGLTPLVQEEGRLEPLNFRFGAFNKNNVATPLGSSFDVIKKGVEGSAAVLEKIKPVDEKSMWHYLKNRQLSNGKNGFLLIFDQFEELFTHPLADVHAFGQELSELLYTTIPERFRMNLEAGLKANPDFLTEEEMQQLHLPFELRIVLAIRSDRMSLMNRLKLFLPNILQNCYELRSLTIEEAESAILSPAYLPQEAGPFDTPVFDYEDDAVASLIDFLSEGHTQEIESFQLQILCEYVEHHVVGKQGKKLVTKADIAHPELILENYYLDKIKELPEADQLPARQLIEEGLVFEEEHRRLALYEGQISHTYGVSTELLATLLNTHLIRSEPGQRGGFTYELSHDTLVAPVLKAKTKRLAGERLEAEREAKALKEAELAALRNEAELERKKAQEERLLRKKAEVSERRARQLTRVAAVAGLIALLLSVIVGWQVWKYDGLKKEADDAMLKVDSAWVAVKKARLELTDANYSNAKHQIGIAKQRILDLRYADALIAVEKAAEYGLIKDELAKTYLEIAFWYGETGHLQKAIGLLDSAHVVLGKDKPSNSLGGKLSRVQIIQSIENLDSSQYHFLLRRYYPYALFIKGGTFQMGCDSASFSKMENIKGSCPLRHTVTLNDYYMAETETTMWQFGLYRAANGEDSLKLRRSWKPTGDHPVVSVSWYDAIEYANWVSQRHPSLGLDKVYSGDLKSASLVANPAKNGFRLPTEAEWEYAASTGGKTFFAGTSMLDSLRRYGNYHGKMDGYEYTSPSKLFRPNAWKLYDMSGNVWEWCWDWHSRQYYEDGQQNPWGPEAADERVRRGGSWDSNPNYLRCAERYSQPPGEKRSNVGFRLARGG